MAATPRLMPRHDADDLRRRPHCISSTCRNTALVQAVCNGPRMRLGRPPTPPSWSGVAQVEDSIKPARHKRVECSATPATPHTSNSGLGHPRRRMTRSHALCDARGSGQRLTGRALVFSNFTTMDEDPRSPLRLQCRAQAVPALTVAVAPRYRSIRPLGHWRPDPRQSTFLPMHPYRYQ